MDKRNLYKKIASIAQELAKNNMAYTRADLAYELQEFGIGRDSWDVGNLINEAYQYFNQPKFIRDAFLSNEGNNKVVDEFEISRHMQKNDPDAALNVVQNKLQESLGSLDKLSELVEGFAGSVVANEDYKNFLKVIVGSSGISKVEKEAQLYFDGYTMLTDAYCAAESDVRNVMEDFVELRGFVAKIYRDYATKLIDIYGDSIKSVAPKLFDFDSVQFLDVAHMLDSIKLEYEQLSENCQLLMSEVSGSFVNSVGMAARQIGGGKKTDLALAAVIMVGHYTEAAEKTAREKKELEILKQNIKHDVTTIKADYARLSNIYKIINDLYIPKVNAFYKHGEKVMKGEVKALFDTFYQDPEAKKIQKDREAILALYKEIEDSVTDNQLSIDYYTKSLAKSVEFLNTKEDEYRLAKNRKPEKPSSLQNLVTFGQANTNYNRDISDWYKECAPVIKEYENYKEDIELDRRELIDQKKSLAENKKRLDAIRNNLRKINKKMMERVKANDKLKFQMASHLEDIVNLLRLAKEILESRLDEKYIRTIEIKDYRDTTLSEEELSCIHAFTQSLNSIAQSQLNKSQLANANGQQLEDANAQQTEWNMAQAQLREAQALGLEKGVALLDEYMQLQGLRMRRQVADKAYDQQLQEIQKQFDDELAKVDKQAEVMNGILQKINTAPNAESLKYALMQLGSQSSALSKQDLDDFINGNKVIEI